MEISDIPDAVPILPSLPVIVEKDIGPTEITNISQKLQILYIYICRYQLYLKET